MDKFLKLTYRLDLPVVLTRREDRVWLQLNDTSLLLPRSVSKELGEDVTNGSMSVECDFQIKLNRSKNFEVLSLDHKDSEGFTTSKELLKVDGKEIENFTSDPERSFYKENSPELFDNTLIAVLNEKLKNGELDEIIDRNDGEPWTESEAYLVLQIYLKTKGAEYQDQMDLIKEYINEGKLKRSFYSVRMMVHGMCYLDEDHQNDGFNHMGKVFKATWDKYQEGKINPESSH